MSLVWIIVGSLGHAIAAVLFASLAILTSRRSGEKTEGQMLVVALALTALWSLRHALAGALSASPIADGVAETARNAAWLVVVAAYLRRAPGGRAARWGRPLVAGSLALLLFAQLGFDLLVGEGAPINAELLPVFSAGWLVRCMFALGGLVLLHGLSNRREHPDAPRSEVWIAAALAFMWAYDFNHYFLTWVMDGAAVPTGPMRGPVMALLAIPLVIGLRTDGRRRFALSRPVALRLVSGGVIALYLFAVVLLVTLSGDLAAPFGRVMQLGLLFALAVAVLALMPSAALRSWLRVEVTKHLFSHRYDYRNVWLGFAATVGSKTGEEPAPLGERVARAIAEVMESSGALLFLRDEEGTLIRAHDWQWPADAPPLASFDSALADRLAPTGWIVDIAADWANFEPLLPDWMQDDPRAWVLAPFIYRGDLAGAILLAQPEEPRRIDWEDLDVLRVVCGEAAALLSEARSREALAEAQRFDEFNRRFAFILHDIKNLVSQMSLLASNAERHADNPAFRADMVLTLKETAARMTDLLQRLGRPDGLGAGPVEGVMPGAMVRALLPRWTSGLGPVEVHGDGSAAVRGDADALERTLGHLVKNAFEASPAGASVCVELEADASHGRIHVVDQGCGMTPEFIKNELFRPFSSTKTNGFGLGVHEAKLLVTGMGGTLDVESTPGAGTRFIIALPLIAPRTEQAEGAADAPHQALRRTG